MFDETFASQLCPILHSIARPTCMVVILVHKNDSYMSVNRVIPRPRVY